MSDRLGFIGLGVMGEPMCRNLARKSGAPVAAFDLRSEPLARLSEVGVATMPGVHALARSSDIVLLSLPGGPELESVCNAGLLDEARPGQIIVDLGTSPVSLSRALADRFKARGAGYADAPVARTRKAAEAGTLSIMVGGQPAVFERIRPYLSCCASEVTHCGGVGAGQVVKLMNNMVLFQTVVALAEALTVGRGAGVDGRVLLETLSKGSADSFALRNHGMNALLPGEFPELAFPTDYAAKDLGYAMALAGEQGLRLRGAAVAAELLAETSRAGWGQAYFPALINVVARTEEG